MSALEVALQLSQKGQRTTFSIIRSVGVGKDGDSWGTNLESAPELVNPIRVLLMPTPGVVERGRLVVSSVDRGDTGVRVRLGDVPDMRRVSDLRRELDGGHSIEFVLPASKWAIKREAQRFA